MSKKILHNELIETEINIKLIKDTFEKTLSEKLNLIRVSAPLFVLGETGLNDNLNGYERCVKFDIKDIKKEVEIVQSLAKWKRMALDKYHFEAGRGLYTDMNAIRRDEDLDALHSAYVDQWDWEKVILKEQRTEEFLESTVKTIFEALKETEKVIGSKIEGYTNILPEEITFINSQELLDMYPTLTVKERESAFAKEHKAIFIKQIGWNLSNGQYHDGRAADYDDWNLNGDIVVWNEVLNMAFEISSMGVRVDKTAILKQLEERNEMFKVSNPFVTSIVNETLPFTIGGGIGQSRMCMLFLKKKHIGEVQSSLWNDDDVEELKKQGIFLL